MSPESPESPESPASSVAAASPVSTRVAITHRIEQRFERQVSLPTHWLRLRPAPEQRAEITAFSLAVHAEPHFLNWVRDPFENHLGRLDFPEPIAGFGITLELVAELTPTNPFDFLVEPYAAGHPFAYPDQLKKELSPYLLTGEPGPRLGAWLAKVDRKSTTTVERLDALNRMVQEVYGGARGRAGTSPGS
jgi:transglutaminase-like putative cysteine protease